MHTSILLFGLFLAPAFARVQRNLLYGVPIDGPDEEINGIEAGEVALLPTASAISTQPPPLTTPIPNTPGLAEPCAIVSSVLQAVPSGTRKVIPAELGLRCLQSVPLDVEGNIKLIEELKLYLQWQSNLAYLKNPPAEYTEKPVDIIAEMGNMQRLLRTGAYLGEYDFQLHLNNLFGRAYDNHLAFQSDAIMQFQRPAGLELVSVSSDGVALPEIFSYRDILLAHNDPSFKPSPIRTINGRAVEEDLTRIATQADYHDANARWNTLFPNQALIASGVTFLGSFRTGRYQGPNTTISFANETTNTLINIAVVIGNFSGVDSGRALFDKFCNGPRPTTNTTATATRTTTATSVSTSSQTGYPQAAVIHPNLSLGGYFLDDAGYNLFQDTMRDFIRESVRQNKTKLIVDLRGNGGGNAILGYDSFKQLFPQADEEPFGATRYRANEALNITGQMVSDFNDGKTYVQQNQTAFAENFPDTTLDNILLFTAGFNFKHQLDIDLEDIGSWPQMFNGNSVNRDNFTVPIRYNFSDEPSYTYPGFSVIGFLNNTNETSTPQPFESNNIIMLHDGMCSSTCTIVSELLKNQGSVRTIVVGGQHQVGPMQGIGGTKGAQSFEWDDIRIRTQIVFFLGSPEQQAEWNATGTLGKTAFATQLFKRSAYSGTRPAGGINLRDNLRRDDPSQTPLEFIYEAADCRMWYTQPMIFDVTQVWKSAYDRMWRNVSCVQGSTGHASSISGGGQGKGGELEDAIGTGMALGAGIAGLGSGGVGHDG
ncbi:hypothetical protein EJ04DRAFT_547474 [Polyplosphaeria fusca]|uniref:Tail specific protease domain-containing protein n=1 Tax=Polyplosphaeria fusca TaxID=682080 RepID=A0A9P4UVK4_9PLEO|nr:hypothetical protein EJ04DRAFT_547474 [Polyplosphaeria fusca]